MSKLSNILKAAINAPFARPGTINAPKNISSIYNGIQKDAASKDIGLLPWLAISTAATMTMNSPDSLTELHRLVSKNEKEAIENAKFMREVGLKCISFNGIPRVINQLGKFRDSLPSDIASQLPTASSRMLIPENINDVKQRGQELWKSIYDPFDQKLVEKLTLSHPDLPIYILNSHYGALLSDFPDQTSKSKVGRVLTSLIAISCLRAQTGVGPQVVSHIFGLRKAFEDDTYTAEGAGDVRGGKWLARDEGNMWVLKTVDGIVEAIGCGAGTSFAPGFRERL